METSRIPTKKVTGLLRFSARDIKNLYLLGDVDGGTNAGATVGAEMRKVVSHFLNAGSSMAGFSTYEMAEGWVRNRRAEDRLPQPNLTRLTLGHDRGIITSLCRAHWLGLHALTADYIAHTSPEFSEVISLRRRLAGTFHAGGRSLAERCIDGTKVDEGYAHIMGGFSAAALDSYLDMRSQEDGFTEAMKEAAEARRQHLLRVMPPALPPLDMRPWEIAD